MRTHSSSAVEREREPAKERERERERDHAPTALPHPPLLSPIRDFDFPGALERGVSRTAPLCVRIDDLPCVNYQSALGMCALV